MGYVNTDLVVISDEDISLLVAGLEEQGLHAIHLVPEPGGGIRAGFEVRKQHAHAGKTVRRLLRAVERLDAGSRQQWDGCRVREFDLGYQGDSTSRFSQDLEPSALARIAAAGAGLRITIYPPPRDE